MDGLGIAPEEVLGTPLSDETEDATLVEAGVVEIGITGTTVTYEMVI